MALIFSIVCDEVIGSVHPSTLNEYLLELGTCVLRKVLQNLDANDFTALKATPRGGVGLQKVMVYSPDMYYMISISASIPGHQTYDLPKAFILLDP